MDAAVAAAAAVLHDAVDPDETRWLWVFAYGSLCWRPGFDFQKAVVGHVGGYARRFWQGNTTHRGTEDKPGRVATLVEEQKGRVHGIAYAVSGDDAVPYLSRRECELGGYISHFATFHPARGEPFKVLVYMATPRNPHWLGEARLSDIAEQIADCSGPSGHNVEYVVRLANFMRDHFPGEADHHLYGLEEEVMKRIEGRKLCLGSMMGDGKGCVRFVRTARDRREESPAQEGEPERENLKYAARIAKKNLRCLNI